MPDLATIQRMFAENHFATSWEAFEAMKEMGLQREDLRRAVCAAGTRLSPIHVSPDPVRGEFVMVTCNSTTSALSLSLWYISVPPPSIMIETIAVG